MVELASIRDQLMELFTKEGWQNRGRIWSKILDGIPFRFKMQKKTLRYEKQNPETGKWEHLASGYYSGINIVDGIIKGLQEPAKLFGDLLNRFKPKEKKEE
jgi:hypothetical protein